MHKGNKFIHKIWFNFKGTLQGEEPSIILQNKQSRCMNLNQGYQVKLWKEEEAEELIKKEFPIYYPLWKDYPNPIQKVDALKYFLMYRYGGVYMDMDIECLKSFDDYFDSDKVYLVEESNEVSPYRFNNFLLASPPGHIFWMYVFRELQESRYNVENFTTLHILDSTGPGVIQRAYRKYTDVNGTEEFHILPKDLFNPCDICGNVSDKVNSAYLVHESNVSWSESAKVLAFLMCNKGVIIIVVLVVLAMLYYTSGC